ncbi:MAG: hypothetical protein EBQ92_14215 [Proteobacteria bacterium]|nr:hypothetical protein [Pseudomonadota bacterium]
MSHFLFLLVWVLAFGHKGAHAGRGPQHLDFSPKSTRQEEAPQFAVLRAYLEKEKENTPEKSKKWVEKVLQAMATQDPEKVKIAIEELLIEDQMFLSEEQERQAFGKPLKEFSAAERKELVLKYTKGQKEVREKLLDEVAKSIQGSGKPGARAVGETLVDIKKDHLEAYDRVLKEIGDGKIDTATTHCFTCGEGEEIGKTGYTFGGAMREAANRVSAAFAGESKPAAPAAPAAPASTPAPKASASESAAQQMINKPVRKGSRTTRNGRTAFEGYLNILKSDPQLSEETLKRFLKSGYYGNNNPDYRTRIDSLNREELLKAVSIFLDGEGPYNHCPSCNLGAGRRLSRVSP